MRRTREGRLTVGAVKYVGRVGALAVALGVGGVIAGIAPAAADTGPGPDTGSAQSSRDETAGGKPDRARVRAGAPARAGSDEAASDAREVRRTARPAAADSPARDGVPRRSGVSAPDLDVPDLTPPADLPTRDVEVDVPASAVDATAVGNESPESPESPEAALPPVALTATPAVVRVPVMTAAAPGAVSTTAVSGLLGWLGGPGRTDIPAAAPLVWAAAAVSRRELSPPRTTVLPVAAVTTAQLADQIAGFGLLAGLPAQLRTGIGQAAADWIGRTFGSSALTEVSALVSALGSNPSAADIIAGVGDAVQGWWADSGIEQQVRDWATGVVGSAEIVDALADAAARIAGAADPIAALPVELRALLDTPAVRGVVDGAIADALDALATEFGPAVSDVIAGLVDDVTFDAIAGAVTGFLDQPGIPDALAGAAGEFATALFTGAGLDGAATSAWRSLQADPAIQALVEDAVSNLIGGLLGDADTLDYLGGAVSGLVSGLAGDASLGELAGSLLTGVLGHPGVPSSLAGVAGDFAAALLAGTDLGAAAQSAWQALQSSPAILAAVDLVVPDAVRGLLNDTEVRNFLDGAVAGLVTQFVGDAAMGARLADQIVPLMVSVLLDGPAVVDDFEVPITELLRDLIIAADPASADLAPVLAEAGFALLRAGLLGEYAAVPSTIAGLATDPDVLAGLAERIAGIGVFDGLPAELRTGLGEAAADFIEATLGNPVVAGALSQVFAAIDFPTGAAAVSDFLNDLLQNGFDAETVLAGLLGPDLPAALAAFLGDPDVGEAFGAAAADLVAAVVSGFVGASDIRDLVGEQIAALLTSVLGNGSVVADLGGALSDAVLGLLADAGIGEGLGAVAGSVLSGLFGDADVATALAEAAEGVLTAVVSGGDPAQALQAALAALQSDPAVIAAVLSVLDTALDTLGATILGNAAVQEALGAGVAAVLTGLADDEAIRTLIGDLLGAGFGPTVVGLLAEPDFGAATAALLGSAVTDLLGYPGVSTALTDTVEQIAAALLAGTDLGDAVQDAVQTLAAAPALREALEAVLPGYLDTILDSGEIRDGLSEAAQQVVTDLLRDSGIDSPFLTSLAGRVTEAATASLLANAAFGGLINDLAADILGGTPISEVTDIVVQAVLREPALQIALGAAVGQGIGAILGDNIIGAVVGQVAGVAATVLIGLAAGITLLFNPAILSAAAVAAGRPGDGYFELIPGTAVLTVAVAV